MNALDSAETAVLAAALEIEPATTSVSLVATADGAEWDAMANIVFGPTATMDAIELDPVVLAHLARIHPPAAGGRYVIHAAAPAHAATSSESHSQTIDPFRVLLELESV